jgi:hypothetical protein
VPLGEEPGSLVEASDLLPALLEDSTELKIVTGVDVGNAFKGELVDVFIDETLIQVWSKNHLIRTVARQRSGPVRKVRADGLKRQASAGYETSSISWRLTGGTGEKIAESRGSRPGLHDPSFVAASYRGW